LDDHAASGRAPPVLDPVQPLIDAMLVADLSAPRKQQHTARRVLARMIDEHWAQNLAYGSNRDPLR
jgi:hypothetical protein